jgi:hypothetical protein
MATSV